MKSLALPPLEASLKTQAILDISGFEGFYRGPHGSDETVVVLVPEAEADAVDRGGADVCRILDPRFLEIDKI